MHDDDYLNELRQRNPGRVVLPTRVNAWLGRLKTQRTFKPPTRVDRAKHAWAAVIGEDLAHVSEVKSFTHGDLRVTVSSQALVHELGKFRHDELVSSMNEKLEGKDHVARIVVRSGRLKK